MNTTSARWIRSAGLAGCLAGAIALSACSSSTPTASATGTATGSPTPSASVASLAPSPSGAASPSPTPSAPASASAPAPSASPTPTKTTSATSGFTSAQTQWKKGATAISAVQGKYWAKAAADLKAGEATDGGDTSFYPSAIKDLKQLISLPDAQQSPTQNAEFKSDVMSLNGFFQTPGLYQ